MNGMKSLSWSPCHTLPVAEQTDIHKEEHVLDPNTTFILMRFEAPDNTQESRFGVTSSK